MLVRNESRLKRLRRRFAIIRRQLKLRHIPAAERRERMRRAAKDPAVDRALQELFAERPELRNRRSS